jgi:hypothetical protein
MPGTARKRINGGRPLRDGRRDRSWRKSISACAIRL